MSSKDIFLLSSTPEILQLYSNVLEGNGCKLVASHQLKSGARKKKISSQFVIVESKGNWIEEFADLHDQKIDSCLCIIVGSSKKLKEDLSKIHEISKLIFGKLQDNSSKPKKSSEKESLLVDILEERLCQFVARTKSAGGKDLYSLLIREIEKPLIKAILKETDGNQIKAAQILGMNRNTLRKKIKGLKISLK